MAEENKTYKPANLPGLQVKTDTAAHEKSIAEDVKGRADERWAEEKVGLGEGGLDSLNSYDVARGTAILTDLAGIAGSAVLGAGNIGAAATGVASTGLDLYADSEDGLDLKDWGNAALNLGLDIATLIPAAGTAVKTTKVVRGLKRSLPLIQKVGMLYAASHGVGAVADAYDKIQKRGVESLTMDDYANIARGLQAVIVGGRVASSGASRFAAYDRTKPQKQKQSLSEQLQESLKTKQAKMKDKLRGEGKNEEDITRILNEKKLSDSHITEQSGNFTNKFMQGAKNIGAYVNNVGAKEYSIKSYRREPTTVSDHVTNWAIANERRRAAGRGLFPNLFKGVKKPNINIPNPYQNLVKHSQKTVAARNVAAPESRIPRAVRAYNRALEQAPTSGPSFYDRPRVKGKPNTRLADAEAARKARFAIPDQPTFYQRTPLRPRVSQRGQYQMTASGLGTASSARRKRVEGYNRATQTGTQTPSFYQKSTAKPAATTQRGQYQMAASSLGAPSSIRRKQVERYNRAAGATPQTPSFYQRQKTKPIPKRRLEEESLSRQQAAFKERLESFKRAVAATPKPASFYQRGATKPTRTSQRGEYQMRAADPMAAYRGKTIGVVDFVKMSPAQQRRLLDGGYKMTDEAQKLLWTNEAFIKQRVGYRNGGKLLKKFQIGGTTDTWGGLRKEDIRRKQQEDLALKAQSPANRAELQKIGITDPGIIYLGHEDGVPQLMDVTGRRFDATQHERLRRVRSAEQATGDFLKRREAQIDRPTRGQFEVARGLTSLQPGVVHPKVPFRPVQDNTIGIEEYLQRPEITPEQRRIIESSIDAGGPGRNIRAVQLDDQGQAYDYLYEDEHGALVGTGGLQRRDEEARQRAGNEARAKARSGLQGLAKKERADRENRSKIKTPLVPLLNIDDDLALRDSKVAVAEANKKIDQQNADALQAFKGTIRTTNLNDLLGEKQKLKARDLVKPNDLIQLGLLAAASKPVKAHFEEPPLPTLASTSIQGLSPTVKRDAERAKAEIRSMKLDTSDPSQRRQFLLQKASKISDITKQVGDLEQKTIDQSRLQAKETDFRNRQLMQQALQARTQARNQRALADAQQKAQGRSVLLQGLGKISSSIQERATQKQESNKMYRLLGAKRNIDLLKEENAYAYDKLLHHGDKDPNYASKLELLNKERVGYNDTLRELFKKGLTI